MIDLLLSLLLLLSPVQVDGRCVHYAASHDWDRIAALQGVTIPAGHVPIARPDCGTLGSTGTLYVDGLEPLRWVQADCAAPQDRAAIERAGIVGELPYYVAADVPGFLYDGWVMCRLEVDR